MPLILVSSPHFADHRTPPGHPERADRAAVMDVVAAEWRQRGGEVIAPRAATAEQLLRVHDPDYVKHLASLSGSASALDPDTYTSPETYEIALLAAGASIDAVERVLEVPGHRAIALIRPPGHHAERNRAMGFCFFNNIAIAAAHAKAAGLSRIAIVDFDVHHGNGTDHMFRDDPGVLYVSTHQWPFYPGTGAADEIGTGRGTGFTVNVPIEGGALDEDYRIVFGELVVPVLRQYQPQLVLVSAGLDAHERDPLAGMRLTSGSFAAMTTELRRIADEFSEGRIAVLSEGGYDLRALTEGLQGIVGALADDGSSAPVWPAAGAATPRRGRAAITAVKAALEQHWSFDA